MNSGLLTWVEIDKQALTQNVQNLKRLLAPQTKFCAVVKSNAYGHDLILASKTFLEAGADWLAVHSFFEAQQLRSAGIAAPVYILGYIPLDDLEKAVELDCRMVVYNKDTIERLGILNRNVNVHIKVETGTHRQGVLLGELSDFVKYVKQYKNIVIEGVSTHFANIEDTKNDTYYQQQLSEFKQGVTILAQEGINPPIKHCAAAAAAILFPESQYDMVRMGISIYGMWPSEKIKTSYEALHPDKPLVLTSAFTWKSRIAQIKDIPTGKFVGYGCTFTTSRPTKMAVIPVGYFDGYARALSGKAHVLVAGKKASLMGRVSMNNIVIDITDIPDVYLEDEVVLLGKQNSEEITAEQFAEWADTINYEITTRIPAGVNSNIPRIVV